MVCVLSTYMINHMLYYFDPMSKVIVLLSSVVYSYTRLTDAPIENQETVRNENLIKNNKQ